MVMEEHRERCPGLDYSILATDISTRVLEKARAAIYPGERGAPLPRAWQQRYLMRGKDRAEGMVRVVPELRSRVRLARLNFQDQRWEGVERMDVIFCRNVLIYFERPFQIRIVGRLLDQLEPGGFLFLGHAEMLHGSGLGLRPVGPMVYRKDGLWRTWAGDAAVGGT
jgi:chemotaxis protein methyltransferase CheR